MYSFFNLFPDNKLLNSLISCEPETVLAMPDSSVPDDEKITQMLSNLYEKQLVGIIEWAKQIPGLYCNEFLNDNISIFLFLMDYFLFSMKQDLFAFGIFSRICTIVI